VLRQSRYRVALVMTLAVLVWAVVLGSRFRGAYQTLGSVAPCEESNQGQTLSPDRRYIATVFVRDCGAPTGYVTHVNLRKATDVFMADRGGVIATGQVVTTQGVAVARPTWVRNAELEVRLWGEGPLAINVATMWNDVVIHAVDEGKVPAQSP
jgi:hypothetical protein